MPNQTPRRMNRLSAPMKAPCLATFELPAADAVDREAPSLRTATTETTNDRIRGSRVATTGLEESPASTPTTSPARAAAIQLMEPPPSVAAILSSAVLLDVDVAGVRTPLHRLAQPNRQHAAAVRGRERVRLGDEVLAAVTLPLSRASPSFRVLAGLDDEVPPRLGGTFLLATEDRAGKPRLLAGVDPDVGNIHAREKQRRLADRRLLEGLAVA